MSASEPLGLVLDTNVVLDWLVFDDPAVRPLAEGLRRGRLRWWICPSVQLELEAVLARPLPASWDSARELALTTNWIALATPCPDPPPAALPGLRCSDPDDQKFIDLAVAQTAAALLTRDRALLALGPVANRLGLSVVTPGRWTVPDHAPR